MGLRSPRRAPAAAMACALGLLALVAQGSAAAATGGPASQVPADAAAQNLPNVPDPGAPDAQWAAWAVADRAAAEEHDWAADSLARGCTLVEVDLVDEVDPGYNTAMGAPADLVTVRADLLEDCPAPSPATTPSAAATNGTGLEPGTRRGVGLMAVPSGAQCNTQTHGPGTLCISSSGGRIYASWAYRGTGSVSGFLRIYQISAAATGCPTGTTWHTGAASTWNAGQTRSTSKTQATSGAYSAHIWRAVAGGHTDWGQTCGVL